MVYAFDLHLMNYSTNVTRPVGYDFATFEHFPTDDELYDVIAEKYGFIKNSNKTYLFNYGQVCLGLNFEFSGTNYRLIANNVRSIGKTKNMDKYVPEEILSEE